MIKPAVTHMPKVGKKRVRFFCKPNDTIHEDNLEKLPTVSKYWRHFGF
jgi:hypothetical protein